MEFPNEPWVVCFVKDGKKIVRMFWAAGYYNAFDKVLTYAEKRRLDVLWFKEKRYCDNIVCKELEAFCVYCNNMFEESNAIQCHCNATLCSMACYNSHNRFKHKTYSKVNVSSKSFPES